MAIDTAARRYSMLNFGKPWVIPTMIPDGTIGEPDRAHLLNLYSGISLSSVAAPTFTGEIHNRFVQKNTGTHQYDYSGSFSGTVDSYSISPAVETGWSFNTSTGVLTIDTDEDGVFGNYIVTATNVSGSANSNAFKITVNASSGGAYRRTETLKPLSYYEEKVKRLLEERKEELEEKLESQEERLEEAEIQRKADFVNQNQEALVENEIRILEIRIEIQSLMDEITRMSLNNLEITRLAEILQDDDEVLQLLATKGWF